MAMSDGHLKKVSAPANGNTSINTTTTTAKIHKRPPPLPSLIVDIGDDSGHGSSPLSYSPRTSDNASMPSSADEPLTPTRRHYKTSLREGFYKMFVHPIKGGNRRSFSLNGETGANNGSDSPQNYPPHHHHHYGPPLSPYGNFSPLLAPLVEPAWPETGCDENDEENDDPFSGSSLPSESPLIVLGGGGASRPRFASTNVAHGPRSTSAKSSPYRAQKSLDSSSLFDERSPKRVILFKESALASGVELMEAANLENKELLFYHLLKVNKSFNILPNSSKVVVFDVRLSVKKAFYALVYNSVRAATLVNAEQNFVGMLTITDFIQILHHHEKHGTDYVKELEHNTIADWKSAQAEESRLKPFLYIYSDQSLYTAVQILLKHKVHRLPIIDSRTHNILYILTLKRLLKYLYLYTMDLRPSFLSKTPKELGIGTYENIVTATHETLLRDALHKFVDSRVSSLPVLDAKGAVVDIYCKFDVINLVANNSYHNLDITLREALRQRHASQQREDMRHRTNFFEDVIKCSPTDSLWKVIETLVTCQIHRVMITDESHRMYGLVSLSDIFKFLIIAPPTPQSSDDGGATSGDATMPCSTSCSANIGTFF